MVYLNILNTNLFYLIKLPNSSLSKRCISLINFPSLYLSTVFVIHCLIRRGRQMILLLYISRSNRSWFPCIPVVENINFTMTVKRFLFLEKISDTSNVNLFFFLDRLCKIRRVSWLIKHCLDLLSNQNGYNP